MSGGFFGKLPARGDFVGLGLASDFVRPWDAWLQAAIAGSREHLGPRWTAAWLEAPVWRFLLPAGTCGAAAMLGLWLPSVDRAGRHFPLTIARPVEGEPAAFLQRAAGWLDLAEAAGCAALAEDLAPEALATRLAAAAPEAATTSPDASLAGPGAALWWTEGAPRVPPAVLMLRALPDGARFAAMLDPVAMEGTVLSG